MKRKDRILILVLFLIIFVFIVIFFIPNRETFSPELVVRDIPLEKETKETLKPARHSPEAKPMAGVEEPSIQIEKKKEEEPESKPPTEKIETIEEKIEEALDVMKILFSEEEEPTISFEEINQSVRKSLVNVLCITKTGGSLNPLSGSGIIIDDRGVILTNAHVAQYYLLMNYLTKDFITCTIRMGSPSRSLYKAELMYISDRWIKENYENIIKDNYSESGEDDYAFLLITEPVYDGAVLPDKFDFVKIADMSVDIRVNDNVIIAGYPAGFLGGITIQKDLYLTTTIEQINEVFTFKENTLDLISLGGSILAQKGSSGGAIMNNRAELIAIPVTSTETEQTDERDLRAITVSHISRSLREETGENINSMLSNDPKIIAELFNTNKFEELKSFLIKALEQ